MLDDFTKVDLVKTIDLEDRAWEDNARPCLGKYDFAVDIDTQPCLVECCYEFA